MIPNKMINLTLSDLRRLLDYDRETGIFRWLTRRPGQMQGVAGSLHKKGYLRIRLLGVQYPSHQLAWFYVYGAWPAVEIDHKDTDRTNNRIANLRLATIAQNQQNSGKRRDNTSGFKGVTRHKSSGKWCAQIRANGIYRYLGSFDNPEDAHVAYCVAAKELHGEFARTA